MPTATHPPRCPHRVAVSSLTYWQTLLFVSLLGTITATVSLHGQEISLLDYRLIDPASHMQPWPYVEPEVLITPKEKSPKTKQQPTAKQRNCYQALPLSVMSVSIALPKGKLPTNAAAECAEQNRSTEDTRLVGSWAYTEHRWSATCTRHRPLYFEEINAERYGYTVSYALQPVISAAHFFGSIPALPYKMAVEPPRDCIYTLGHYRPGSCVPRRRNRLPWQPTASVVEVGFIAGMILLIP